MLKLSEGEGASVCELGMAGGAKRDRRDDSGHAVAVAAILVPGVVAREFQLARGVAAGAGADGVFNSFGADYRLGGGWVPNGAPRPSDSE